jgi:hypothetical protein
MGSQSDGSSFFGLFTRAEKFPHSHLVGRVGNQQLFYNSEAFRENPRAKVDNE